MTLPMTAQEEACCVFPKGDSRQYTTFNITGAVHNIHKSFFSYPSSSSSFFFLPSFSSSSLDDIRKPRQVDSIRKVRRQVLGSESFDGNQ